MTHKKNRWIRTAQNLIFWVVSFVIALNLFSRADEIRTIDWIYTFLFHIPFAVAVCINLFYLIPKMLQRSLGWLYAFMMIPLFGITYFLYQSSYGWLSEVLFPDYFFVPLHSPTEILGILAIYITTSTLVELSKSWFEKREVEVKLVQMEEEKTRSELKALQAQINPHFLFNSLNTIYGEALKKTDKAPGMILKLSDILRYVVEHMNKSEVLLKDEIEYIQKFIDLQKERLTNPDRVILNITGDFESTTISPLLLITYIENAFKHGSVSGLNERIRIDLSMDDDVLTLKVENNKNNVEIIEKKAGSGKGIENTEKRLNFLYPDKHSIKIEDKEDEHKVELRITLV